MNSKKIISAFLAVAMTFSFVACTKKEETKKITGDITQPSFENGTAVIEYPSTDENGKEIVATTVITTPVEYKKNADGTEVTTNASNSSTSQGSNAIKVMFTNPLNDILESDEEKQDFITNESNNYNISTEDAKKIVSNADKWVGFYCNFYVVNTNKQRISTREIQFDSNSDIIVDKRLDSEHNFITGNGRTICVSGYVNADKYSDDNSLINALNSMNIQLIYTLTDESSIDDWSKVTTKTMKIKF